jgi:hypothetical protein
VHAVPFAAAGKVGSASKQYAVGGRPCKPRSIDNRIAAGYFDLAGCAPAAARLPGRDTLLPSGDADDGYEGTVRQNAGPFVKAVKAKEPDVLVKVIIECYYLSHDEKVTACNLVVESGADYVKQSTGTTPNSSFCLGDTRLLKNRSATRSGSSLPVAS